MADQKASQDLSNVPSATRCNVTECYADLCRTDISFSIPSHDQLGIVGNALPVDVNDGVDKLEAYRRLTIYVVQNLRRGMVRRAWRNQEYKHRLACEYLICSCYERGT